MCGIVGILRADRAADDFDAELVVRGLLAGRQMLEAIDVTSPESWLQALQGFRAELVAVDATLRSAGALAALSADENLRCRAASVVDALGDALDGLEGDLDRRATELRPSQLEALNAAFVGSRDIVWSIGRDRIGHAEAALALGTGGDPLTALDALSQLEMALSALDRLEVRGRDSAGLHALLEVSDPGALTEVAGELERRQSDALFRSRSVVRRGDHLGFVYKAAAEIGELGDNGRELRRQIVADATLQRVLAAGAHCRSVLGHTRWASVGLINEANAHPLDSREVERGTTPYVVAALNGDIDNYLELAKRHELRLAPEITTDAKVIPALVARRLAAGDDFGEAFRRTVASFEGSIAIAAQSASAPDQMALALRGSGQALYVGLADGLFLVSSEPYGLVEQCCSYLRLDGETPADPERPDASRGQVVVLDRRRAGRLDGVRRVAYDGTELPVAEEELVSAAVTTRDIDRGSHSHFFLKEVRQAPESVRRTLRGKMRVDADGKRRVELGRAALPAAVVERLASGSIRRIEIVGQGTAAVAAQSMAEILGELDAEERFAVRARPATELSAFRLRDDMSDTLVVAISQSGTTTDTNRTIDLVTRRGAATIAIVNRRGSDLVDKVEGVLFTSDGRDVEMSVASTKAFYAQVVAGGLLALALHAASGGDAGARSQELMAALEELPRGLQAVLELQQPIAELARRLAPCRRHWAVVGNGRNRIAAEEVRIKLSELCYKSIACDATEDKKHIDLSSEPLILVCAVGLQSSTAGDVAKEVAIYRAHKAAPILICDGEEPSFDGLEDRIVLPATRPCLAFVLATMAGHLFGYEAARAIHGSARPLREMRAAVEEVALHASAERDPVEELEAALETPAGEFEAALGSGLYDGQLEASTAVRLNALLRFARRQAPLERYFAELGRSGSPSVLLEDLANALSRAIDELTRPIDAIKHQAKTVTVGVSRGEEGLLLVPLVRTVMAAGVPREHVNYTDLKTLAGLDPAVQEVAGFTRYRVFAGESGDRMVEVTAQGGIAKAIPSRTADAPRLKGTKHLVATRRQLLVARGRSDGRTVMLIPEIDRGEVCGLLLLHVVFRQHMAAETVRGVLDAYRGRYLALRDEVMETESDFDDALLERVPVIELLTEDLDVLAGRWSHREESGAHDSGSPAPQAAMKRG